MKSLWRWSRCASKKKSFGSAWSTLAVRVCGPTGRSFKPKLLVNAGKMQRPQPERKSARPSVWLN